MSDEVKTVKLIPDGGDYSKMPYAEYGHDAYGNPVTPEVGYILVAKGETIIPGDKPFDVYAGWVGSDGYHARNEFHAVSRGRWTTWERKK